MATSTLYHSPTLTSPASSPRSCLYQSRPQVFQTKADWRATFTSPKSLGSPAVSRQENTTPPAHQPYSGKTSPCITKPLILRQHNGIWLTRTVDTAGKDADDTCDQVSPASPCPKPSPTKSKLSLGRIPKTLHCYVCQQMVRESNFTQHMFFGALQCDLCGAVCGDCRSFEQLAEDLEMGNTSCIHSLEYREDPFLYLAARLPDCDPAVGEELSPVSGGKAKVLQQYVSKLSTLQLRDPWSTALRKCKAQILKLIKLTSTDPPDTLWPRQEHSHSRSTEEDDSEKSVVVTPATLSPALRETSPVPTTASIPTAAPDIPTTIGPTPAHTTSLSLTTNFNLGPTTTRTLASVPSPTQLHEEEVQDSLLLTQSYDLEQLERAVEYVDVADQYRVSEAAAGQGVGMRIKKRRKMPRPYRKLKSHRLTARPKSKSAAGTEGEEGEEEEQQELTEMPVQLPEDGYYLMVRVVPEECPMCYTALSPAHCTVNLTTLLVTAVCVTCSLTIYIVPDRPDGLTIVTEKQLKEARQAKKRHRRPKVRPTDFFAK